MTTASTTLVSRPWWRRALPMQRWWPMVDRGSLRADAEDPNAPTCTDHVPGDGLSVLAPAVTGGASAFGLSPLPARDSPSVVVAFASDRSRAAVFSGAGADCCGGAGLATGSRGGVLPGGCSGVSGGVSDGNWALCDAGLVIGVDPDLPSSIV